MQSRRVHRGKTPQHCEYLASVIIVETGGKKINLYKQTCI